MWKESERPALKKNKVGGRALPDSRLNCKATVIQAFVFLCILKMKFRRHDSLHKPAF